ncbi:pyridoxamine 5'-phosphate oxidase family protein [Kribbella antiqua]|uniref:Pyridoxamine 5'-phosphate oxidase family protein n=1 Tax=Kribbella antiqua TaxID=2512217 RepID=A0A4R2ITH1_9ACTN|nr:PPOX class F420-dependent oxidoreductase [Kribbella antiqua]TCO46155.1 pyridoxamine 5'-phosphate oxidase family protein [Kribbella antiqua]
MAFTEEELTYLKSQPLARIATVGPDGQPDVVPVGFEYDGTYFYVGGIDPDSTRKVRNVRAGHTQVALVIDDLVSTNPWSPRFLRIYGTAEVIPRQGRFGETTNLRITPTQSWSWHLSGHPLDHDAEEFAPRRTVHSRP